LKENGLKKKENYITEIRKRKRGKKEKNERD